MNKIFLHSITDRSTSLLRHPLALAIAALAALGLIAFAVSGPVRNGAMAPPPPDAQSSARAVRVAEVQSETTLHRLRLPGVTRAAEQGELAFLHGGHLAERLVRRGQTVAAGEVLAILHNPALMPGLSAAEANVREIQEQLDQVEREVRRIEDLYQRNLVSTEERERIISRRNGLRQSLSRAEAGRAEAREQLAEAELRAPWAGTIVEFHAEPGQYVGPGQPVMSLASNGPVEVLLQVSAERAMELRLEEEVRVLAPATGISGPARIREIGLATPGRPAPVLVTLDPGETQWHPGMAVQVDLTWPGTETLTVPLAAIIDPAADNSRLFRVVHDRALLVPVTLGTLRGDRIAVEGPLAEGDVVVIAGQGQLLDDQAVRVLP